MAMDRLKIEVAEAVTVMGAAKTLIGALYARLKTAQEEAAGKGVEIEALNALADDLDANANALAEALKENTEAAAEPPPPAGEPPAPEEPTDPDADANPAPPPEETKPAEG